MDPTKGSTRLPNLILAVRIAEADRPGVPVVGDARAVDQVVRPSPAPVLAIAEGTADREAGEADLGVGIVVSPLVVGIIFFVKAPGCAAADDQVDAVEIVREVAGDRKVLGILTRVNLRARAEPVQRVARVFRAIRRERRREAEAGEVRAEVDDLRRLVVEAVAGAVRGAVAADAEIAVTADAGVGEVEVRRVGTEDSEAVGAT